MSLLDPFLVVLALGGGVLGWHRGFVQRVAAWAGLLGGLAAGVVVVPFVVASLDGTDRRWLVLGAAAGLVLLGAVGQAWGTALGHRLRRSLPASMGSLDAFGGACMGVLGTIVVVWLLAPAVRSVPAFDTQQIDDSVVIGFVESVAPDAPDLLGGLESVTGRFPKVFAGEAPPVSIGAPPEVFDLDPTVDAKVAQAVFRVRAIACSQRQDGTAFLVAPGILITNAHVVAGSATVEIFGESGRASAEVVAYDPARDLAMLAADGLPGAGLDIGEGSVGQAVAVYGHPLGGDLRMAPARIGERVRATGRDLYDRFDTVRQVYFLATRLQPGDSGGPVVDGNGVVVGVVFAISPEADPVAFALTARELEQFLADGDLESTEASGTGACL